MKNLITKLLKNQFIQGGFLLTASNFFVGFLNYLFNFIIGRSLGPKGYGEITALTAYSFIASVPVAVLSSLVIQKISSKKHPEIYALSLEAFLLKKLKKWWFLGLFLLFLIPLVPMVTNLTTATGYALLPVIALSFLAAFYGSALQAMQLFLIVTVISIITVIIKLISGIFLIAGFGGISLIVIFIILSTGFLLIASHRAFHLKIRLKKADQIIHFEHRLRNILLDRQVILYTAITLAFTLFNNIDIIFVKKFFSANDAGIYGSWSLLAKIIVYSLSPLATLSFIYYSNGKYENKHNKVLIFTLVSLFMGGVFCYLFYVSFGTQLILTLFGNRFIPVVPYLGQASIFGFLYMSITFINAYLMAKKNKSVLLFCILIPLYCIGLFFIEKRLIIFINYLVIISVIATMLYVGVYLRSLINLKKIT